MLRAAAALNALIPALPLAADVRPISPSPSFSARCRKTYPDRSYFCDAEGWVSDTPIACNTHHCSADGAHSSAIFKRRNRCNPVC